MGFFNFFRKKNSGNKQTLEESVRKSFDLTLDTDDLLANLAGLRTMNLAGYGAEEVLDVFNSLIKKANVIYSAYGRNGKFSHVAKEFAQSAMDMANNYNSQKIKEIREGKSSDRSLVTARLRYAA